MQEIGGGAGISQIVRRPLSGVRSSLYFLIPLLFMVVMFWGVVRLMDLMGVRLFVTFLTAIGGPYLILFLLAVRFYRKEGNPWTRAAFAERMRLRRLTGTDWLWTILLTAFFSGIYVLLSFTSGWLSEIIPQPKYLYRMLDRDPNYFMEFAIGPWILIGIVAFALSKSFGEELWFRGYVLPGQELVHGKWTLVIHGLQWCIFYLFTPWYVVQMLPAALAIAFVAQRLRNTWPGIIAQLAASLLLLFRIL